ncbi:MAG: hypothetical protein KKF44_07005 [Nanoarchaeota archaeon]|nr:hypothetical protein [Nanoarchaeota archaeon]
MKKDYKKMLAIKSGLIIIMLGLLIWKKPGSESISVAMSIIMVLIATTFLRLKKPDSYKQDERTKKLYGKVISASWLVTLLSVTLLYWNNYLKIIYIPVDVLITMIFVIMVASNILFRFYYMRKGDTE